MQKVRLDSREQRKRLAPRDAPYYQAVGKGIAIGYRKGVLQATWSLRRFNGGKYTKSEVGIADDSLPQDGVKVLTWLDVMKLAVEEPAKAEIQSRKYSVRQCGTDYLDNRKARSRSAESIEVDTYKLAPFIAKFGAEQVSNLTTVVLQRWRDGLVNVPAVDDKMTDTERRELHRASQNSANRVWSVVRAALNFAFRSGRVESDLAWRRVKPFDNVDGARTRFLSVAECNKLLGAAEAHFRDLVQGALVTGLRPGELVRLTVSQFQKMRIEVSEGKTGSGRHVPLTAQGQTLFKRLSKGRVPGNLLLTNPEGLRWTRMQIARAMRAVVAAAKLDRDAVFYDLRRTYGSLLANAQANDATIANLLGHRDTRMVRQHYGHLLTSTVAAELQAKLPKFRAERGRADKKSEDMGRELEL